MARHNTLAILTFLAVGVSTAPGEKRPADIVTEIQRADYEGDRAALKLRYEELQSFAEVPGLASRVRYWLGFAMWRRALNGFNESVDRAELEEDLKLAEVEFENAMAKDPTFIDAKVGAASCLANLSVIYFGRKELERSRALLDRSNELLKQAEVAAPDNPRMAWVLGANLWYRPLDRGGGQARAIETYERALKIARKNKRIMTESLDPSWGEAELLMNLAWSNLNTTKPDFDAAESYAQAALKLVPYWHYVRNILLPQIENRRRKQQAPAK
jgi:tetratricopeptide (TPR) repeat protein